MEIRDATVLFSSLPPERKDNVKKFLQASKARNLGAVIVLDDDPTGTQTVHGIPVLTQWSQEHIEEELRKGTPLFYILTNSRSLDTEPARELASEIGRNICEAAEKMRKKCWVISRSDSTLRGHYPSEVQALKSGLAYSQAIHFIVPAFFEGGRYTVDDVHYVQKDNQLIPAALTPYAQDKVFGFRSSNLRNWVEEKTKGRVQAAEVASIGLEELRRLNLLELILKLQAMEMGSTCVVNAAHYSDLQFFALGLLESGIQPVLRTAASFVAALATLEDKALLLGADVVVPGGRGGLVVVGSYVPTTTSQLEHLLQHLPDLDPVKVDVRKILQNPSNDQLIASIARYIDERLLSGDDVVLYTSRELVADRSASENQEIGRKISAVINGIVGSLGVQPKFLVTKGGITSSDVATKSLGVQRAMVEGQIIKGVPVWKLGAETKFPGLSQVIFPGNVGTESSLTEVVKKLSIGM